MNDRIKSVVVQAGIARGRFVNQEDIRAALIGAAHEADLVPEGDDTYDDWVAGHLDSFVGAIWKVLNP